LDAEVAAAAAAAVAVAVAVAASVNVAALSRVSLSLFDFLSLRGVCPPAFLFRIRKIITKLIINCRAMQFERTAGSAAAATPTEAATSTAATC